MYEIEAGKTAQQMGKSQAVKDFGEMMVEDHTKATADLKAAAGQVEGLNVSAQLNAKQQSDLDALRSAGENFDRIYAQQQVDAHTQALAMLRWFAGRGDAQPLKDFAAKTAPVVERASDQGAIAALSLRDYSEGRAYPVWPDRRPR